MFSDLKLYKVRNINDIFTNFRYELSKEQVAYGLPTADVRGTILSSNCPLEVDFPCQPRKYRAFSGYCNNVQNPSWGNSNRRFVRFLAPDYADCKYNVNEIVL